MVLFESLNSNLLKLFNKHVPLKRLKLRSRRPPWYKLDVHRCINERNKLYKSNTSAENRELFRFARNKVHVVTKNAKCEYYRKEFNMSQLTSKNLWKKWNNIGLKKNRNECSIHPEIMNDFFSQCTSQSSSSEFVPDNNIFFRGSSLVFIKFSDSRVYNSVLSIKSNAVGPDGIHLKFLKL